jgi:hypothetical protein
MPSDSRIEIALRAVASAIERYRSAVITTAEEVRGYLSNHRPKSEVGTTAVAAGLGQFVAGRIDVERFSALLQDSSVEDTVARQKVEKAYDALRVISAGEDDLFCVKVKPGHRLRDTVAGRLAEIGRAFAAARIAGRARAGRLDNGQEGGVVEPMPFDRWNEAERGCAPPLVVELEGSDLHAADLAEFLDGSIKFVLVVRGESPPAPLVRLITPSTFVLQTCDETGLDRFVEAGGPAVAALVPESAARFLHDPRGGPEPRDRIEVFHIPQQPPKRRLGGMSVRQQADELEQLRTLAACASVTSAAGEAAGTAAGPTAPADPVDKLAAWLLSQADLSDLE